MFYNQRLTAIDDGGRVHNSTHRFRKNFHLNKVLQYVLFVDELLFLSAQFDQNFLAIFIPVIRIIELVTVGRII